MLAVEQAATRDLFATLCGTAPVTGGRLSRCSCAVRRGGLVSYHSDTGFGNGVDLADERPGRDISQRLQCPLASGHEILLRWRHAAFW